MRDEIKAVLTFDPNAVPAMTGWVSGGWITGPNCPTEYPTLEESCTYKQMKEDGASDEELDNLPCRHSVITLGQDVIAIIPGPTERREAIARRIVECVNSYDTVFAALQLASQIIEGEHLDEKYNEYCVIHDVLNGLN